ncbi:tRNA (adenosine(37)-N6)-threonylcarbamoyltransferase complex dimerization subunit type 1 TsaB [Gorillibacterium timonense]|uniref:tRNA (adenosine(37)-N6)-threonylcarbamoyltransferase complex dimerization subunit type 1 TsaB n=1 Tax=Gorillibacterium timonense TaxID=1689269 RepID=UPI00071CDA98|nr:tRNA (adenosine(37)-N6)-threonylcarbamoyltransferase complex dimerization subunit type 1 TsaB [Gorillibacterium timonense]
MNEESIQVPKAGAANGGKLLVIDTSSASMTAALLEGNRLIAERKLHAERNHSIRLLPLVEEMLESAGVKPAELSAIATGVGPGSYTGVRIGVTVAKTMAWAQQIPVAGVSSLASLALGTLLPDGEKAPAVTADVAEAGPVWIVPLLGARRGQAYTALFRAASGIDEAGGSYPGTNGRTEFADAWTSDEGWTMSRLVDDAIHPVEQWLEKLLMLEQEEADSAHPARVVFTGETEEFLPLLSAYAERRSGETTILEDHLRAYACGLLAVPMLAAHATEDPHRLLPNYTQLAEAEVKLAARLRGENHT